MAPPEVLDYVVVHELAHMKATQPFQSFLGGGCTVLPGLFEIPVLVKTKPGRHVAWSV